MTRIPCVLLTTLLAAGGVAEQPASEPESGRFWREYWYEPGIEHGNPRFDGRFRVNAPEVDLDIEPGDVERAELHVVVRDGGAGTIEEYFTLNGEPLDVAGDGAHDVLYRVVPLEPSRLRPGPNRIELLSDTDHHGIEILLPGPAIVVRTRASDDGGTR